MGFGKIIRIIKSVPVFLVKFIYILPFLLFGAWLLKLVYFQPELPQLEAKLADESPLVAGEDRIFKKILLQKDAVPREHFHLVDEWVTRQDHMAP
ncbi:MAG: hypothetical protein JSU72_17480, partial [Deltaproteobacteria bacterium]